jgi:intracellular multiplication protein IcmL
MPLDILHLRDGRNLKKALTDSGNLDAVVQKKLVISAIATGSPVILNRESENGKFTWQVQLPLLVTWQSANDNIQSHLVVNMRIVKMSDKERDFAINSFIATPKDSLDSKNNSLKSRN